MACMSDGIGADCVFSCVVNQLVSHHDYTSGFGRWLF